MLLTLLPIAAAAAIGVLVQLRSPRADELRRVLWTTNYVVFIPVAATFALLTIELDADLLATVAVGVAAWWCTVGVAYAWARATAPTRVERGALTLVGGFPNTGFIGFPLALLAFGTDGLRLAIVYDQVSLVVPAIAVGLVIARRHARPDRDAPPAPSLVRQLTTSPPLWTVCVLLALRATVAPDPLELRLLGEVVGAVVGPVGFLLLGLSVPLHGFTHDRCEVGRIAGAVAVRVAAAPALVAAVATAARVEVPTALYLVAAMPTGFHVLVTSRLHGVDPAAVRLGVALSSLLVVGATVAGVATGLLPGH